MQILLILWEPNDKWHALSHREQADYLRSLDGAINEARSHGVMTLGWSRVDRTLNKAPAEGYVGVFAMESAQAMHQVDDVMSECYADFTDAVRRTIDRWQQQYQLQIDRLDLSRSERSEVSISPSCC